MPVPTAITDLSTTIGSNSPATTESPGDGDDYIRALSAFIASLRNYLNGTTPTAANFSASNFLIDDQGTGDAGTFGFLNTNGPKVQAHGTSAPGAGALIFKTPGDASALVITSDGRLYGSSLHNNAGAVTGTTNQYIASGTYTPTLTGVANLTTSTANAAQWMRVGNVVTVSVRFSGTATANSTLTVIGISLPIASDFANQYECAGAGQVGIVASGFVEGDTTNNRASLNYTSGPASAGVSLSHSLSFSYVIL